MLAIGSKIFDRPDDMVVVKGILETCVHMYRSTRTNLSPEVWGVGKDVVAYNPLTYGKSEKELRDSRKWWFPINDTEKVPRPKSLAQVQNTKNRKCRKYAFEDGNV
jgi:mannosyl-oligosaccharide alpha-1,2-mannosidase